jgi:glucose-6-phosphate dehydrogenase assembly protein OpcA
MNIDLTDTNASQINATLIEARRRYGSPASSAVLTLVIVTDEQGHYDALRGAIEAAREHPARILSVIRRPGRGEPRLDAEVRTSGEAGPGEVVVLRMHAGLADHAESVVLPLLLPDAPVVTWWPGAAPDVPAEDKLGILSKRRVTDAGAGADPLSELVKRAAGYRPGDTDLSWTRLTPWRTMLAAALDAPFDPIRSAEVASEPDNPSAELLARWLEDRLGVPVERHTGPGPGINAAVLHTEGGDIALHRSDGRVAQLSRPGWPERPVALRRRSAAELLTEELRRLDEDEVYGRTLARLRASAAPGRAANASAGRGEAAPR